MTFYTPAGSAALAPAATATASASTASASTAAAAGGADGRMHLAMLTSDAKGKRWLRTYTLDLKDRELKASAPPLVQEDGASWLLPAAERFGGLIVVGEEVRLPARVAGWIEQAKKFQADAE